MKNRPVSAPRRFLADAAEEWELPYTEREGGHWFLDQRPSHPWCPRAPEELPPGAFRCLEEACGIEGLHQLFVIPFAVRQTGLRRSMVTTPLSVLAVGSRAVGLWTEKPSPGLAAAVRLDELEVIEDVTILLYGRLSFISAGRTLTVRYNTVSRRQLEPALLALRRRVAGPGLPVPTEQATGSLPFKWNHLLNGSLARLRENAPAAFRFACVPARSRRAAPLGHLLVLNPFELVWMRDPPGDDVRYGVDSFIIPRSRLTALGGAETGRRIDGSRSVFALPMPSPLREAASRWLGAAALR